MSRRQSLPMGNQHVANYLQSKRYILAPALGTMALGRGNTRSTKNLGYVQELNENSRYCRRGKERHIYWVTNGILFLCAYRNQELNTTQLEVNGNLLSLRE